MRSKRPGTKRQAGGCFPYPLVVLSQGRVVGKYEAVRRIATGGMGEIFLGRQLGLAGFERFVILKTLLPQYTDNEEMRTQFFDEARIVGSINHPNVVAMYELGEADGTYFIAMEHINGVDLATLLREGERAGRRPPPRVVAAMIRDAAAGLDSAHHAVSADGRRLNIIHRDVSPQNIMVRRDGHVKVVDFGVAMADNRSTLSESGMLKGKFAYLAPEQIQGAEIDARCDQFPLGAVAWELLAGRRLFKCDNQLQVFKLIISENVEPPSHFNSDVPPTLDAVVLRLLERDPERRFSNIGDAAAALQHVVDSIGGPVDEVARYVESVVGAQLKSALEIKPQASTEAIVCPRCGEVRERGRRFCSACGADTGSAARPRSTPGAVMFSDGTGGEDAVDLRSTKIVVEGTGEQLTTPGHRQAREAAVAALATATAEAQPLAAGEGSAAPTELDLQAPRIALTAIWYRLLGMTEIAAAAPGAILEAAVAELHRRLGEVAEAHGGALVPLTAGVGVLLFGTGGASPDDADAAIRCAADMPRILEDMPAGLDGQVELRAAVASGEAEVGANGVRGAPIVEAQRVCDAEDRAAILVAQSTLRVCARTVSRAARQITVLDDNNDPFSAAELVGDRASLPATSLKGRDRVRAELTMLFEAAAHSRAPAVVVLGDAGMGKSATLQEAAAFAQWKGLVVARATCRSNEPVCPLYDIRQLVFTLACSVAEAMQDRSSLQLVGETRWQSGLTALPGLTEADQRRLHHLVSGEDPPLAMALGVHRILLRASVTRFFGSVARNLGLCLLIDDLHAMDPLSFGLLTYTLSLLSGCRAICVASARPTLARHVWPNVARTTLEPLPADAIHDAAHSVSGDAALGPRALALVVERARGNPTAARAAAQLLFSRGLLAPVPGSLELRTDVDKAKVPVTLPQIVVAQLMTLGEGARAEMQLQAAHGEAWLSPSGTQSPQDVAVQQECLGSGLAAVLSQPAVRDVTRAQIEKIDLPALHAKLAARVELVVEAAGTASPPHFTSLLAYHLAQSGDRVAAHQVALAAARAEHVLGVGVSAEEFATRMFAVAPGQTAAGGMVPAVRQQMRTIAEKDPGSLFEMAAFATEALVEAQDPRAPAVVAALLPLVPARANARAAARAYRQQGIALADYHRPDLALTPLETALELASFAGDQALELRVRTDFAAALEDGGDAESALAQLLEVVKAMEALPPERRDELVGWQAPLSVARLRIRRGEFDEARDAIATAQAHVVRTSSLLGQAEVYGAQSSLAANERDLQGSTRWSEQAIAYADAAGDVLASVELRQATARRLSVVRREEAKNMLLEALDLAAAGAWPEGYATTAALLSDLTEQAPADGTARVATPRQPRRRRRG